MSASISNPGMKIVCCQKGLLYLGNKAASCLFVSVAVCILHKHDCCNLDHASVFQCYYVRYSIARVFFYASVEKL